jgi:hypothetical protein
MRKSSRKNVKGDKKCGGTSAKVGPTIVCHEHVDNLLTWSCERDEGRPLEAGDQDLASNHRELLSLRAMVVSVAETMGHDPVR